MNVRFLVFGRQCVVRYVYAPNLGLSNREETK
jgi:hypothetical protein